MSRPLQVGIYLQSNSDGLGGAEFWSSCLASTYGRRHQVTLIHHKPSLVLDRLAGFTGLHLDGVREERLSGLALAWMRRDDGKMSATERSADFDVFITITHYVPPLNKAPVGALIVLFPIEPWPAVWPWSAGAPWWSPRAAVRRAYYARQWRLCFESYRVRTALSAFAQDWVWRYWNTKAEILYPPNDLTIADRPKQDRIVSVGRFTTIGATKSQRELAAVFRDRVSPHAPGWTYATVGSVSTVNGDREYFEQVRAEAAGAPIHVERDLTRSALKELVASSKIFWHGAGLHVNETRDPIACEHFGHVTVEAMAAGAVPVVIGRGGQKEIVRHEIDGFLCDSLEDIVARTRYLLGRPGVIEEMSRNARERAQQFSLERSVQGLARLVEEASSLSLC